MNTTSFDHINSRRIQNYFDQIYRQNMQLHIDPNITYILNRIIDNNHKLEKAYSDLRPRTFTPNIKFVDSKRYAILMFPDPDIFKILLNQIKNLTSLPLITVTFIPRITELLAAYLIQEDYNFPIAQEVLFGKIINEPNEKTKQFIIESLNIELISLDSDLVTALSWNYLPRLWAFNDMTVVSEISHTLNSIKYNCGGFASVTSVGNASSLIAANFQKIYSDSNVHLILIDRNVDYVTPLLTQAGYEGLIAELVGIKYGICSIPDLSAQDREAPNVAVFLNSYDKLFDRYRLLNYDEAYEQIKADRELLVNTGINRDQELKQMATEFSKRAQKLIESKTFAYYLTIQTLLKKAAAKDKWYLDFKSAVPHIIQNDKRDSIKKLIDSMFLDGADFRKIAALLCLDFLVNGEPPSEDLPTKAHANYGLQQIPFLLRLGAMGLLQSVRNKQKIFQRYVKSFKLLTQEDPAGNFYYGYVPLTTRIIETIIDDGLTKVSCEVERAGHRCTSIGSLSTDSDSTILIGFVGGCTHSELNVLRRIGKDRNINFNFFTTRVLTTQEFMDEIACGIPGWDQVICP